MFKKHSETQRKSEETKLKQEDFKNVCQRLRIERHIKTLTIIQIVSFFWIISEMGIVTIAGRKTRSQSHSRFRRPLKALVVCPQSTSELFQQPLYVIESVSFFF